MSFEPIRRQSARHDPFAGNAALMLSCPPRCPPQVHAALIVVLTRGGSTARLVAKYRPSIPVLTVAVPVLTTDSLTWTCSGEQPARAVPRHPGAAAAAGGGQRACDGHRHHRRDVRGAHVWVRRLGRGKGRCTACCARKRHRTLCKPTAGRTMHCCAILQEQCAGDDPKGQGTGTGCSSRMHLVISACGFTC